MSDLPENTDETVAAPVTGEPLSEGSEDAAMSDAYRRAMGDEIPSGGESGGGEAAGEREVPGGAETPAASDQTVKGDDGRNQDGQQADASKPDDWLAALPDEAQAAMREIAGQIAPWRQVTEAHSEYLSRISRDANMAPHDVVDRLLAAESVLRYGTMAQKRALFQQMKQDYGIRDDVSGEDEIEKMLGGRDPVEQDKLHDLMQQNAALQARLEQIEAQHRQMQEQAVERQLEQQIAEFASAKDEDGNAKYPHFDLVRAQMGALLESGQAQDLASAYEIAVKPLLEEIERRSTAQQQRAESVKKSAAVNVDGLPDGGGDEFEDEDAVLRAAYRAAMH